MHASGSTSSPTLQTSSNAKCEGPPRGQELRESTSPEREKSRGDTMVDPITKSIEWRSLKTKKREIQITSDASNKGWGVWSGQEKIGSFWTSDEEKMAYKCQGIKSGINGGQDVCEIDKAGSCDFKHGQCNSGFSNKPEIQPNVRTVTRTIQGDLGVLLG